MAPSIDLSENRRLVTVLFGDLSGSTALGERLDPEDLRSILASYFGVLSRQIQRFEGTVDKYIGDAVMAVFGAPVAHEDDPERAINAALAMQEAIGRLNDDLERRYGSRLSLRIGINTGEVVAGLLAGDVQGAYTVVGDTVNTAQRFESAAPAGGVLVSEPTWRLTRRVFRFESIEPLLLKGKTEPQAAYRVLGRREQDVDVAATPLIGREADLQRLHRALEAAFEGNGSSVHISGEAGVGKSRLVREFRSSVHPLVVQLIGRCASFETDTPYALIARVLRFAFSVAAGADESAARTALTRGFALAGERLDAMETDLLLEILGYGERSLLDPESKQRVLLGLVRRYLGAESDRAVLLVIVEDLHWVDAASCEVLSELARDVESRRILLVTTSRQGWQTPWQPEVVSLEPLHEIGGRELVEAVFGAPVADSLAELILSRTGGNPFFVEEVVRGLWESDVLVERDGRITVQADLIPRVPATVQEVVTARLDRLPPSAKRVLQPAAVFGRVFRQRVIEYVLPDTRVDESLGTLEREAFILRSQTVQPEPTYLFRHALIQEVAYQNQLQSQRRVTHGAIGGAIETLYADRLDEFVGELAFHFGRSDNDAKALQWLVRAGDRAKRLFANQEALTQYAAALDRAQDGEGPLDAGTILERIGDIQSLIGRYDEAIASFRTARDRIPSPGPVTVARLLRKIGTALRIQGAYPEASSAFDDALDLIGDTTDIEAARIRLQIGQLHWRTGEYTPAQEALTKAVDIATGLGNDDVLAEGLKQLGNIPLHAGDPRDAVEYFRRSQAIYERMEDLAGIAAVRLNVGVAFGRMGQWDECLAEHDASLELHKRIGDRWHITMIYNNMGELHRMKGNYAAAVDAYERALAIKRDIGDAAGVAVALTGVGMARVESGELERGRADLIEAEARFSALGRSTYMPVIYRFLASAELSLGDTDSAARYAAKSIDFARSANARHEEAMTQRVMGEILIARGDIDAARAMLESSRATLAEVGEAGELARTEAVLQRLTGMQTSTSPR